MLSLTTDDVNNREDDNPNDVDEMPIHGKGVDVFRMLLLDPMKQSEKQNREKADEPDGDVERVESNKGVIGGTEEIGGDGESLVVDEVMPFATGSDKKDRAEDKSEEPPEAERVVIRLAKTGDGEMNGEAAGEKANGSKDGKFENFAGSGAGEAFANVIKVGNDEDSEDGRFRGDQAEHADMPLVGAHPLGFEREQVK